MKTETPTEFRISAFVITYQRLNLLRKCCASILKALPENSELVVIVNGKDTKTEEWLSTQTDSRLRWHAVPEADRSTVRNQAWHFCQGDILHFLDDDVEVPAVLFENLRKIFSEQPSLAIVGGPNLTPPDTSWFEQLSGDLLASPLCCPLVWRRYADRPAPHSDPQYSIIGCNFAVNRNAIESQVRFRPDLVSNEENIFHFECNLEGLKTDVSSDIFVYHYRRRSVGAFLKQIYSYGRGRGQQFLRFPRSNHPIFLLPAIVILGLSLLGPKSALILMSAHAACFSVLSLASKSTRKWGWRAMLIGPLTLGVHFAYGFGILETLGRALSQKFSSVLELGWRKVERPHALPHNS